MNNLVLRLLTGAVFVASILLTSWFNFNLFALVMGIYLFGALWELQRFFASHKLQLPTALFLGTQMSMYIILAGVLSSWFNVATIGFIIPLFFINLLAELWRKKEQPLLNMAAGALGSAYLVLPFVLILGLAQASFPGKPLVAGMFILIWTNDSFAYLSGRIFGKTKLFERISPKKTWEGTIGGILFTVGAAVLIDLYLDNSDHLWFWIISALIIAPCAILGDLLESLIKRSLQVKDSGTILPGHGGILDRFDATLFAAPFFFSWYLFYSYFCVKFLA